MVSKVQRAYITIYILMVVEAMGFLKRHVFAGIGRKFTLSLIIFMILPLVLIFIVISQNITKYSFEQAYKMNLEVLKQTKTGLHSLVNDVDFVSITVIGDGAVQAYIKEGNVESDTSARLKIPASYNLYGLMRSRPYISSISLFTNEDILLQFGKLLRTEDKEYIEPLEKLSGSPLWTASYKFHDAAFKKDTSTYVVSLMRVVNDLYSFQRLGFERITIDESYISSLYSGISSDEGLAFIANNQGDIVSSTDKTMLGTNINSKVEWKHMFHSRDGYFTKEGTLYTYYYLDNPGWYVVKAESIDKIYVGYAQLTTIIFLCLSFTLVFGVVFLVVQERSIIRPVKALAAETEKFKSGDYHVHRYTKSNDEIGILNQRFIEMGEHIQLLIDREYKSKINQKEIEIAYMQSQMNPHFLYNTLDSIRWMAISKGRNDIGEQIEALSDLMRHALNKGKGMTTVSDEVVHIQNYMKIQQNRFGDRITYRINAQPETMSLRVMHLILQPLVENAVVHGLENQKEGGQVLVEILQKDNTLHYIVSDNGEGTDEEQIRLLLQSKKSSKNFLALKNIDERIRFRYGDEYGLTFNSKIGYGTTVIVTMPCITGSGGEENAETTNR